jgi:UDP-N-acetylmuramoylalanine--D-glutamate ligase
MSARVGGGRQTREELRGASVVVAGIARSGVSVCRALLELGADVHVVDEATSEAAHSAATGLRELGARVTLGPSAARLGPGTDLLVASPGWPPHAPLLRSAAAAGVPVWGEVELAWRLREDGSPPWLVVTGTNGKTTTTRMLESMLGAAGLRTVAVGNIGVPITDMVAGRGPTGPLDVLAVELGSPQLETVISVAPHAATVLNIDVDHVDFHGSFEAYVAAKRRAFARVTHRAVYNRDDQRSRQIAEDAFAAGEMGQAVELVGFGLAEPPRGAFGVVDGELVDNAEGTSVSLGAASHVVPHAPHNVANALAAAALARSFGVEPSAISRGLRSFVAEPHRIADVATVDGVRFVDDSKATNVHAASTSLAAYDSVVWVAGGLAKGARFDDLVAAHASRLRGVVLLGADRHLIAEALARHAPEVPVVPVGAEDTERVRLMDEAVASAAAMARPGDTVLLAPACASWDQFSDYAERGTLFAEAVTRRAGATS